MAQNTQIACPQCGHSFNVEDVLSHQIEEKLQSEMQRKMQTLEADFNARQKQVIEKQKALEDEKSKLDDLVAARAQQLSLEQETALKKKLADQYENQMKIMSAELAEKSKEATEGLKLKLELERLKRDQEMREQELRLNIESEMAKTLGAQYEDLKRKEADSAAMKLREKDELIKSMSEQLTSLKQKAEQGSQERQGEIQELVIAEWLQHAFPRDEITDIKKGQKGADVLHTVKNFRGEVAGKIYYESKRTAKFEPKWIGKLKEDNRQVNAEVLVIITQALPDEDWQISEIDGVWICSFHDFKAAALLLREGLIRVDRAKSIQSNSGDKMKMLYDYLVSIEFKQEMENIIEGFKELQDGYLKERQQMEKIWKAREKQLGRVLGSANSFIGSIQGIAGTQIPQLMQIDAPAESE